MQTLPIHIDFFIEKEKINQIILSSSKTGITWEIKGEHNPHIEKSIIVWMNDYAAKKEPKNVLPLDFSWCTPFDLKVLEALNTISFGKTLTYKDLAIQLGIPKGARAVGGACGRNRFPLVIPCHRVIAQGGKLGGFLGGISMKQALLSHEEH